MKALRLRDHCHLDYTSEQMLMKTTPRILDTYMMSTPKCVKNKNMAKFSHLLPDLDEDSFYSLMNNEPEDDIYSNMSCTPTTLMPSDDIWKKFDLLPTPPRSPKHDISDFLDLETTDISQYLQNIDLKPPNLPFPESPPSSLCSKLIQDCMWSGSHNPGFEVVGKSEKSTSRIPESRHSDNGQTETPSDCVDPAAVFPYPISDTRMTPLVPETPSDSEEEIDVVSTEDIHEVRIPSPEPMAINVKTVTVRTESVKKEAKAVHVVIGYHDMDVHNYSLPSHSFKRTKSSPCQTNIAPKRIKRELSEPDFKRVCQKLKASSRSSSRNNSDSEESCEGKRTQHNVLERKRRNDLKYSFFTLRDTVPELREKEKAPKVLILRKSADYIYELRQKEQSLAKQVQNQKDRHEKLRRTLSSLRR